MKNNIVGSLQYVIFRFFLISVIVYVLMLVTSVPLLSQTNHDSIEVLDHWQYKWTDAASIDEKKASKVFLKEESGEWLGYDHFTRLGKRGKFLWLKSKIPARIWHHPHLFLYQFNNAIEIYIEDNYIGKRNSESLDETQWPFFRLGNNIAGKTLYLRVDIGEKDYFKLQKPFLIGAYTEILFYALSDEIDKLILGIFFFFIGLFVFLTYERSIDKGLILAFGFFSLLVGIYNIIVNQSLYIISVYYKLSNVYFLAGLMSLYLIPAGLGIFIEKIFGSGYKGIIRRLWQLHLVYAIMAMIMGLFSRAYFQITSYLFFVIAGLSIIIIIIQIFAKVFKGNSEARVFAVGFAALAFCILHDTLRGFEVLPGEFFLVLHWGTFIFMISLGIIFQRRFNEAQIRLQAYSQELKHYSENLEQKVEERTIELKEKNTRLQYTLRQIQEMQNQIITQEKLASLGSLTAGIAHEIKNPLNFITNFSRFCLDLIQDIRESVGCKKEENCVNETLDDLEQYAQKINEHGMRADSIVKGMLLHSREKPGDFQLIDLNQLLEEYVNLAYHGMRAKDSSFNTTIKKDLDRSIGKIEMVAQDLSRVFLNLLENAFYATHKRKQFDNDYSPRLYITTKNKPDQVEITIKDNGIGIAEDIKKEIFNPFFTTKPAGIGTGLGLSISYDIIVQTHQGEIKVNSEKGKYTEFIIILNKIKK